MLHHLLLMQSFLENDHTKAQRKIESFHERQEFPI